MSDHEHLWLLASTDGIQQCQYCPMERVDPRIAARIEELEAELDAAIEIAEEYRANPVGPTRRTGADKVEWRAAILREAKRRGAAKREASE